MTMDEPGSVEFATPTLMRAARGAYARSIRAQLHAIGIDDLPRNGAFILAGIDTTGGPRGDLPADLGVTKQAVSQVIDTLASRGYLTRSPDPDDRRRITLELTERGQQVVDAVLRGVEAVDLQLQERVSPEQIEAMRSVLLSLAEIKSASLTTGTGMKRPARQFRQFSRSSRCGIWPPPWPTTRPSASTPSPTPTVTSTASPTAKAPDCTWRPTPAMIVRTMHRRTCTCGTPMPSTRSGAARASAATPGRPARRPTSSARVHTPIRMGT